MPSLRLPALAAALLLAAACADGPTTPAAPRLEARPRGQADNAAHVIRDSDYTRAVTVPCTPLGPETFILYGHEDITWQFMFDAADGVRFRTHVVTRAAGIGPKTGDVYYTTDVANERASFAYGGLPFDVRLVHHFNLRSRDSGTHVLVREQLRVHIDESGKETVELEKIDAECR